MHVHRLNSRVGAVLAIGLAIAAAIAIANRHSLSVPTGRQGRSSRGRCPAIRMLASRVAIWMRLAIERDAGHEEAFTVWPKRTSVPAEAICFVIPSRTSLPIISNVGSAELPNKRPGDRRL